MRIIFIFIYFLTLSSCGGGGGGGTTSSISNAISGVAIDGYLL
jgi:hypothetical protein